MTPRIPQGPSTPIPTWPLIERRIEQAHDLNRLARTPQQFQAVGDACAEVLLLVVYAAYLADRDKFGTSLKLRLDGSLSSLVDLCISEKLSGPSRDAARSSLAVVTHNYGAGTKDSDSADLCLAATTTVVKYLSISSGRRQSRDTVADLCRRFLEENPDLGLSHSYSVQMFTRMPIGRRIASELAADDVFEHVRLRREEVAAATVMQDITYLRGVFVMAREKWELDVSTDPIDHARRSLRKAGLIAQSSPRNRRPTRQELQSLVDYFAEYESRKKAKIPMRDIMEFALWSARRIGEICDLRWEDLDIKNRTCIARVSDARNNVRNHKFPLLGKAFEIVMRQPKKDARIFPYNAKSAGASYTKAKAALGIQNLRFQDLRREAAIRLYEAKYTVEQIAEVTGRIDLNTLRRDLEGGEDK